ncbi:MAG: hypothetical protein DRO23_06720 [Thermoprotei archaeon]|nr:MAG: hypothetical protein DRO23_06720 [Thermoprotei archaeon]
MVETLSRSIEVLRNIDSLIDLGRATAQLKILLTIGRRRVTIDEIVKYSKLKRKTVLDALRKLETKDLVARKGSHYILTNSGISVYETLLRLASIDYNTEVSIPSNISFKKTLFLEAYDELLSALYLLRTLEIIGVSNKPYPLRKLAAKIGVSQITLDSHLRRFTSPELPILRRVYSDFESRHVCYKLTDLGLKFYRSVFPRRARNLMEGIGIILVIAVSIIILLLLL